jgi:hypothetical protein
MNQFGNFTNHRSQITNGPTALRRNLTLAFERHNSENDADGDSSSERETGRRPAKRRSEVATMVFWYYFWTINFIVAGSAFAVITAIVLVRGSQDLRSMFARLKESGAACEVDAPPAAPEP